MIWYSLIGMEYKKMCSRESIFLAFTRRPSLVMGFHASLSASPPRRGPPRPPRPPANDEIAAMEAAPAYNARGNGMEAYRVLHAHGHRDHRREKNRLQNHHDLGDMG
jgi:hypothetical protein